MKSRNEIAHEIGKWLSAALEDPQVCKEMKEAIKDWLEADSPFPYVSKYKKGDRVFKFKGSYRWFGVVSSVFITPIGELRYVVAHEIPYQTTQGTGLPQNSSGWLLHIYSETDLQPSPFIE